MIYGIVLAAGESKRMGRPKQLLPFGDQTLIETVVENVLQSQIQKTVVVLGANKDEIAKKLDKYPVSMIFNPRFKQGMLSSIQRGFEAIAKEASAVLIILGDQPTIPAWVIDSIIHTYQNTGKGIVVPVFQMRRGHPVLFDCKYRDEVAALDAAVGLRALVHGHPDDVEEVAVESPAILKDIDYPEDYVKELQNQKNSKTRLEKEDS